jgi:hypothetical protein
MFNQKSAKLCHRDMACHHEKKASENRIENMLFSNVAGGSSL